MVQKSSKDSNKWVFWGAELIFQVKKHIGIIKIKKGTNWKNSYFWLRTLKENLILTSSGTLPLLKLKYSNIEVMLYNKHLELGIGKILLLLLKMAIFQL